MQSFSDRELDEVLTQEERELLFKKAEQFFRVQKFAFIILVIVFIAVAVWKKYPENVDVLRPIMVFSVFVIGGLSSYYLIALSICPRCRKLNCDRMRTVASRMCNFPARCSRCGIYFFHDRVGRSSAEFTRMLTARRVRDPK
jgi:hypothetical protein